MSETNEVRLKPEHLKKKSISATISAKAYANYQKIPVYLRSKAISKFLERVNPENYTEGGAESE